MECDHLLSHQGGRKVKGKFSQPVVFNMITIAAMLFSLFQMVAVAKRDEVATAMAIQHIEEFVEAGAIEENGLTLRLAAESHQISLFEVYIVGTLLIAVMANVVANYIGRGRHYENLGRIRELEAELRGLRGRPRGNRI